jgi:hypothetical protein
MAAGPRGWIPDTGFFPPGPSRDGDLLHQAGNLRPVLVLREGSPAGQRIELEDLWTRPGFLRPAGAQA